MINLEFTGIVERTSGGRRLTEDKAREFTEFKVRAIDEDVTSIICCRVFDEKAFALARDLQVGMMVRCEGRKFTPCAYVDPGSGKPRGVLNFHPDHVVIISD